jgi:hypothetical protein
LHQEALILQIELRLEDEFVERCCIHYLPQLPILFRDRMDRVFPPDLLSVDPPDDPRL